MDRFGNILKQRLEAGQSAQVEHPPADTLTAFVEHSIRAAERDAVVSHLSLCPTCRQAVGFASMETADEQAQATAPSGRFWLQFPGAMRWASVAAAFAVAMGVGILSYEHELPRGRLLTAPPAVQQPAANDSVPPNSEQKQQTTAEALKPKLGLNDASAARSTTLSSKPKTKEKEDKKELSADYGTEAKQHSANPVEKNQPHTTYDIDAGRETSSSATSSAKAASPRLTAAPTANSQMAKVEPLPPAESAPSAATQSVAVSGALGGVVAQPQSAPKSFSGALVGGTMFRRSLARSNDIARWTISSAGKLLRWAQNGVSTVIEPAPGLAVRAVAAKGIEVWAGGVQPDTSARQWQQRPALFHSSDAGETWSKVDGPWTAPITGLELASENALTVSAGNGTWSTSDGGKNWVKQ